jgi:hypothetical protein
MRTRILASVLAAIFAWTVCGVGDVHAEEFLEGMPSTGEMVAIGVGVALVIIVGIAIVLDSGDDGKAERADKAENAEGEICVSVIGPPAKVQFRVDPVLTLQKDGVGAGFVFSF